MANRHDLDSFQRTGVTLSILALAAAGLIGWELWRRHERDEELRRDHEEHMAEARREEALAAASASAAALASASAAPSGATPATKKRR